MVLLDWMVWEALSCHGTRQDEEGSSAKGLREEFQTEGTIPLQRRWNQKELTLLWKQKAAQRG